MTQLPSVSELIHSTKKNSSNKEVNSDFDNTFINERQLPNTINDDVNNGQVFRDNLNKPPSPSQPPNQPIFTHQRLPSVSNTISSTSSSAFPNPSPYQLSNISSANNNLFSNRPLYSNSNDNSRTISQPLRRSTESAIYDHSSSTSSTNFNKRPSIGTVGSGSIHQGITSNNQDHAQIILPQPQPQLQFHGHTTSNDYIPQISPTTTIPPNHQHEYKKSSPITLSPKSQKIPQQNAPIENITNESFRNINQHKMIRSTSYNSISSNHNFSQNSSHNFGHHFNQPQHQNETKFNHSSRQASIDHSNRLSTNRHSYIPVSYSHSQSQQQQQQQQHQKRYSIHFPTESNTPTSISNYQASQQLPQQAPHQFPPFASQSSSTAAPQPPPPYFYNQQMHQQSNIHPFPHQSNSYDQQQHFQQLQLQKQPPNNYPYNYTSQNLSIQPHHIHPPSSHNIPLPPQSHHSQQLHQHHPPQQNQLMMAEEELLIQDENNALMNKRKIIKKRTRTGCLTCRKRRIKCDERKPMCYNCERSKKVCLGYENLENNNSSSKKKKFRDTSLDLPMFPQ